MISVNFLYHLLLYFVSFYSVQRRCAVS